MFCKTMLRLYPLIMKKMIINLFIMKKTHSRKKTIKLSMIITVRLLILIIKNLLCKNKKMILKNSFKKRILQVHFIINSKKRMMIKLLKDFKFRKRKNIWKIKIRIIILFITVLMKNRIDIIIFINNFFIT